MTDHQKAMSRAGVVGLILGLAAYITGLQKRVLDPILGAFQDLSPSTQLLILFALIAAVCSVLVVRARGRRAEVGRAVAEVEANLGVGSSQAPPTPLR